MVMLNCDMGEGTDDVAHQRDRQLLQHIDVANVACGLHAGDYHMIDRTLEALREFDVALCAHPGYPDIEGFGRRSMDLTPSQVHALLHYQLGAMKALARRNGLRFRFVKPHGALYNDMMKDAALLREVMGAIRDFAGGMTLVVQATPDYMRHLEMARGCRLNLVFEAFADRAYRPDGSLVPRSEAGAVHSHADALAQVQHWLEHREILAQDGSALSMPVDTLCVHGDSPDAVSIAAAISKLISAW